MPPCSGSYGHTVTPIPAIWASKKRKPPRPDYTVENARIRHPDGSRYHDRLCCLGGLFFLCGLPQLAPFHLHLVHMLLHFIDLFFHGLVVTLEGHALRLEASVLLLKRGDLRF